MATIERSRLPPIIAFYEEYMQHGNPTHLDKVIRFTEQVADIGCDYLEPLIHRALSEMLYQRFQATKSIDDLNRAIDLESKAGSKTPRDDPQLLTHFVSLAKKLLVRGMHTDSAEDLNRAVETATRAQEITPRDNDERFLALHWLGTALSERFSRNGSLEDLEDAITITTQANDLISQDHPDYASHSRNLAKLLYENYLRNESLQGLEDAIAMTRQAVDLTSRDHPDYALYFSSLARLLGPRFSQNGSLQSLEDAVTMTTQAIDLFSQDQPDYAFHLSYLAKLLGLRFHRSGAIQDIDRAIKAATEAVDVTSDQHVKHLLYLSVLREQLSFKFERFDLIEMLDRMLEISMAGLRLTPQGHPDRAEWLLHHGEDICSRFQRTGSIEDSRRMEEILVNVTNAIPLGHPFYKKRLKLIRDQFKAQYEHFGFIEDLNRAILTAIEVIDITPRDDRNRTPALHNLANLYYSRYNRIRTTEDLNRTIELTAHCRDSTPRDERNHYSMSIDLGTHMSTWFDHTDSSTDLDNAIAILDDAINRMPPDEHDAVAFSNLGHTLRKRFKRRRSPEDLARAVEVAERAVKATSPDHPTYAPCLDGLATGLCEQFEQAVTKLLEEVQEKLERQFGITGLANVSSIQLPQELELFKDLNRAIDISQIAVEATSKDHPQYAFYLCNLEYIIGHRYRWKQSSEDLSRRFSALSDAWHCNAAPPFARIMAACRAAHLFDLEKNWKESIKLRKWAVSLLPSLSPRYLNNTEKQSSLVNLSGLASAAAAVALSAEESPQEAVRLLELSRGVIAGILMDMRGNISGLKLRYPKLADKFSSLRDELDSPCRDAIPFSPTDDLSSWESEPRRRREMASEFDRVVEEIRAQPGFSSFLQPPTAEDLMAAADSGPIIIINMTFERSDAFLIKSNGIETINLPDLSKKGAEIKINNLKPTSNLIPLLEWLWNTICCPCLDALGFKDPVVDDNWPHVWWIPTGLLSQLPLHAAGIYRDASTDTVLDRVISSYASSVRALLHGRQLSPLAKSEESRPDYAVLVEMKKTPGSSDLEYASKEVAILRQLCPSLNLDPITPRRLKNDVLEHLQKCKVFHFAGHGKSDLKNPSNSCLKLEDWMQAPLTVGDLRDSRLQENPPFFAYLSACETGSNKVAELSDEGIHLVSAFQLAGFRHVVGTLWPVTDKHCVDVASVLYETLREEGLTDAAVGRGLHLALRKLRDDEVNKRRAEEVGKQSDDEVGKEGGERDGEILGLGQSAVSTAMNFFWVPYVHMGA
ncbi:CHAT domain-containing protein [Xylaria curta]|nr:CHAT domain-containing protein [Xylaria curta]